MIGDSIAGVACRRGTMQSDHGVDQGGLTKVSLKGSESLIHIEASISDQGVRVLDPPQGVRANGREVESGPRGASVSHLGSRTLTP